MRIFVALYPFPQATWQYSSGFSFTKISSFSSYFTFQRKKLIKVCTMLLCIKEFFKEKKSPFFYKKRNSVATLIFCAFFILSHHCSFSLFSPTLNFFPLLTHSFSRRKLDFFSESQKKYPNLFFLASVVIGGGTPLIFFARKCCTEFVIKHQYIFFTDMCTRVCISVAV